MTAPQPVTSPLLGLERIRHGFFGRKGGVSTGPYESLNCGPGSDDRPLKVIENRARVAGWFGIPSQALLPLYQIHSAKVVEVTSPWHKAERPEADAVVTRTPGIALSILTADCGPILFADPEARVIGAAHAGWKGAIGGVIENTVDGMISLGARRENIRAVLGPTITGSDYEVGPEFFEQFVGQASRNALFFQPSPRPDHHLFDLPGFILDRLDGQAIGKAHFVDLCTYAREADYFSWRRTTHQEGKDCGRNISAIMLEERS